ncbi:MAG TPA: hypothetical protein VF092_26075 [Longimicrobium sp.]
MRRTLDLVVAAVIVVGGGVLAASGTLSRLFRRDEPVAAAPTTSAPLGAMEELFGAAPPPAFRTMRRDEILEMSGEVMRRHAYTVGQMDRWRSVVSDSVVMNVPQPPGPGAAQSQLGEFRLRGAMDLFRDAWGYRLMVSGPAARAEASTRVVEITGVQGRLFPLAVGNRLRFRAVEHGSVELAGRVRPEAKVVTYEMRVTGMDRQAYSASTPAVPGPVYVIDLQASAGAPDESRHVQVHYAPALGAAVRIRTLGEGPATEERLVSWEPAARTGP